MITPFSGSVPVYSFSFSGGVNLLSDSSLVRIILIDTYGNHYMVFESYPLITMSNIFDTLGAADETTFLDGVICDSLRIDIINAFLEADSLKLDTAYIPDALQLQAQAKWDHDSVMELIDNRFIPMPDSMLAQILEGQTITGMMDSIRIKRASFNATYSQTFNRLLNFYLHDTVIPGVQDSITALFERDFRLHSKCKLTLRLLDAEEYNRGDSLMAAIPGMFALSSVQNTEYQQYSQFYNCLKRDRLNFTSLTFDSVQVENLNSLVLSDTGFRFFPTILAKNALQASGNISYYEPLVFDMELKSIIYDGKRLVLMNPAGQFLRVFPNPAHNYVVISFRVNPTVKTFWITITRMDGTVAHQMDLIHWEDQITWPTDDLQTGSYLVSLFGNGKVVQTQKMIITH